MLSFNKRIPPLPAEPVSLSSRLDDVDLSPLAAGYSRIGGPPPERPATTAEADTSVVGNRSRELIWAACGLALGIALVGVVPRLLREGRDDAAGAGRNGGGFRAVSKSDDRKTDLNAAEWVRAEANRDLGDADFIVGFASNFGDDFVELTNRPSDSESSAIQAELLQGIRKAIERKYGVGEK